MVKVETSFQLLYISRLAADCDFSVVKGIVDVARRSNPARGIAGALLFDGERFCQSLEGSEPTVRELMSRIEADVRHTRVRVLHAGPATAGSTPQRWVSGYCDAHDLDGLDTPGAAGQSPINEFTAVLHRSDIV